MTQITDKPVPSIFNDVIGPVMRGPSSSHCAAAVRIGLMVRDLMDGDIKEILIQFDPNGSLATTHESQGSDMGLFGGLLGWDAADKRLPNSPEAIRKVGIKVYMEITPIQASHPNTYKITAKNAGEAHTIIAISTGGGIIEVIEIDGVTISMAGDYYETLIFLEREGDRLLAHLIEAVPADEILLFKSNTTQIIAIKSQNVLNYEVLSLFPAEFDIQYIKQIRPVLPILSRRETKAPFITCKEMLAYNDNKKRDLWELAVQYECDRGNITKDQVMKKMDGIVAIMQKAIDGGLAGTKYDDRILGYQSGAFKDRMESGRLIDGGVLNRIILYTTALMESKSAMGVIVAAPTAGACGGLPGACFGAARAMTLSNDDISRAMLAGAMIGVFISAHATFAAEVGGCQAECGAGSGMAAAALVNLSGGSTQQAVNAASMALQNILGMICDPVAKRVEVPCLGKNVMAATNALACANMALAGFDPVIPLDEVIQTMDKVGRMLPAALRCTGHGGLSITPASIHIEKQLEQNG